MLYGCADGIDPRSLMDQAAALGFDGGRFFGGRLEALPNRPQTQRPEVTAERIERNAGWLAERLMELHDVLFTDTKVGWDFRRHAEEHGRLARRLLNIRILELGNELGHGSQGAITLRQLKEYAALIRDLGYDKALTAGASVEHDELMDEDRWDGSMLDGADRKGEKIYPPAEVGDVADTHYNRGSNRWPSYVHVAHGVNELRGIGERYRKARLCGEPGRQEHEAVGGGAHHIAYPYLLGISATIFNTRTVYHCAQARDCGLLTDVQLDGAKAIIRGSRVLPRGRYEFFNTNNTGAWPQSPVKSASFVDGPASTSDRTVWRVWSARHADTGRWFIVISGPDASRPGLVFQNSFALKSGSLIDRVDNLVEVHGIEQR